MNARLVVLTTVLLVTAVVLAACSTSNAATGNAPQKSPAANSPGVFRVDNLAVNPAQVNAGVDALITAKVTNTGLTTQKYEGQVRLDNLSEPALPTFLTCQLVNIAPGSTETVSVPTTINNPGQYKVTLDGVTQNIVVNPAGPGAASGSTFTPGASVPASDFTAVDVVTGKKVSLSDYRGKPILLNFVNYGCNPSVNEVVSAQLLTIKKLKDLRSDFYPVSVFCGCCPPEVLKQFAKDNNLNWPWILDSDNSIVTKYGKYLQQYGYPTLVYINSDFVIAQTSGSVSQLTLNDKLTNLVNGAANLK